MKKILYIFLTLSILTTGCERDEDICNCGTITDDEILSNNCYSLTIRNDCSNNYETWCFDYDVWLNNHVGEKFCVTNVESW